MNSAPEIKATAPTQDLEQSESSWRDAFANPSGEAREARFANDALLAGPTPEDRPERQPIGGVRHTEAVGALLDGVRILAGVDRTNAETAVRALYEVTGKLLNVRSWELSADKAHDEAIAEMTAATGRLVDQLSAVQEEMKATGRSNKRLTYMAAAAIAAIPAAIYMTSSYGNLHFAEFLRWFLS